MAVTFIRRPRVATTSDGAGGDDLTQEPAERFHVRRVRDARWLIGLLLLVAGVAGTIRVIAAFDNSVTTWVTVRTVMPGDTLKPSDVRATKVRLGESSGTYFVGGGPPRGVLQQVVTKGQLVPRASVGSPASVTVRTVTVPIEAGTVDAVRTGSTVEVWVAKKISDAGADRYHAPQKVTDRALVARVGSANGGLVSVSDGKPVQLLVPSDRLADVIDAVNSKSRVTLVPLVVENPS